MQEAIKAKTEQHIDKMAEEMGMVGGTYLDEKEEEKDSDSDFDDDSIMHVLRE